MRRGGDRELAKGSSVAKTETAQQLELSRQHAEALRNDPQIRAVLVRRDRSKMRETVLVTREEFRKRYLGE